MKISLENTIKAFEQSYQRESNRMPETIRQLPLSIPQGGFADNYLQLRTQKDRYNSKIETLNRAIDEWISTKNSSEKTFFTQENLKSESAKYKRKKWVCYALNTGVVLGAIGAVLLGVVLLVSIIVSPLFFVAIASVYEAPLFLIPAFFAASIALPTGLLTAFGSQGFFGECALSLPLQRPNKIDQRLLSKNFEYFVKTMIEERLGFYVQKENLMDPTLHEFYKTYKKAVLTPPKETIS